MFFDWNEFNVSRLIHLLKKGASARNIAIDLGTSKNSVISKIHGAPELKAIGLGGGTGGRPQKSADALMVRRVAKARALTVKPIKPHQINSGNIARKKASRIKDPVEVKPAFAEDLYNVDALRLSLLQLGPRTCRWVVNSADVGEPHEFCGKPTDTINGYCTHHRLKSVGRGTESERSASRIALSLVGRS